MLILTVTKMPMNFLSHEGSDASTATAALWTVPALKPFLIFELEVLGDCKTQR